MGHSKDSIYKAAEKHLGFDGMQTGKKVAEAFIGMMSIRRTNRFAIPFYKAIIKTLQDEISDLLQEPRRGE